MDFKTFAEKLKDKLSQPLPGEEAQLLMAPNQRRRYLEYYSSILQPRQSAVLISIYPRNNIPHTVLMLRPGDQGVHSGQVSFPGGRFEESDSSLEETALREAGEEIGIKREDVIIIGKLTPLLIPVSGFHVQPFIGILDEAPVFFLNDAEVITVVEMELNHLLDEKIKGKDQFLTGTGLTTTAPYYEIAGHKVWGATAMMLREMEELLKGIV